MDGKRAQCSLLVHAKLWGWGGICFRRSLLVSALLCPGNPCKHRYHSASHHSFIQIQFKGCLQSFLNYLQAHCQVLQDHRSFRNLADINTQPLILPHRLSLVLEAFWINPCWSKADLMGGGIIFFKKSAVERKSTKNHSAVEKVHCLLRLWLFFFSWQASHSNFWRSWLSTFGFSQGKAGTHWVSC